MHQKDQVLGLAAEILHDLIEEQGQKLIVFKLRLLKPVEQLLAAALSLLPEGEFHVKEVAPELTGHGAAQDLAIFFHGFLLHGGDGVVQLADDFPLLVDITGADPVDAAVGFDQFSYLIDRFFVHCIPLRSQIGRLLDGNIKYTTEILVSLEPG